MGAQPGTWSIREASTTGGSVFLQRGRRQEGVSRLLGSEVFRGVLGTEGDSTVAAGTRGLHRNTIGDFFVFELQ